MKPAARIRIDQLLVDRRLAESREKAQALILAGEVMVDGQKADKPGRAVAADANVEVAGRLRYVSRGGLKLEAALDHFGISVEGRVCLDVGASTGGFTDCLLQRGAARVYAVDTGAGQMDWKIRTDARVVLREKTNARNLRREDVGEAVSLIVCDASFISSTLLLKRFPLLLAEDGEFVILIKPQFEVGKGQVGKGGIVREESLRQAACIKVKAAVEELGYRADIIPSPILGAEGNQEFLLYGRH